ncbi:ubiquitin carboxyl-terminal hydrolase isozyme L5-like protein [Rozella allomycis CSF55]|uniref:Ubiquitin carboxyl-terminal hydrolase n=1 Tax=Rozella allomycis (strain CSF55) TaxID=988480 RepID=A0A075AWV3_ROZAC|nr:Peptidase C12, ubiquitin carboxyl-terminal hydrolase 1 domain-containing protein [Rozella allomycis CSF55]RKP21252.1 ubiquitin carboxyl-terminal hydrolase isozyme L5-like protein [Rozella allomycis CSF55]|eukprot:EPZ34815.1 Peptidase C12, ubiquitin carboxyl-terminal hydrolase 1 domain-containing protein [Rozella allomycis CSF55]
MSGEGWCLIESDPAVFTELLENIGVKGLQVEEVYSFDVDTLKELEPVYGLIFLFKWEGKNKTTEQEQLFDDPNLFFANQMINNACATQAILNICLNLDDNVLNEELLNFKQFTKEFDSETKGIAIGNSDHIRDVHNSFARANPFFSDNVKTATEDDDVFHFTAFIPFNGNLIELDGLKKGPVNLGECTDQDWLQKASATLIERISKYQNELRFSLMAIIRKREDIYQQELKSIQERLQSIDIKTSSSESTESLAAVKRELLDRKTNILEKQSFEVRKKEKGRKENLRRKHNYIPLAVELIKCMAVEGTLKTLLEN